MTPSHNGAGWIADANLRFTAEPDAVPRARRLAMETLAAIGLDDLVDDASVIMTELVTNAVLHGLEPIHVRVLATETMARLEVEDGNPNLPFRGLAGVNSMTGRGLHLVAALARRVGSDSRGTGKVVWAELVAGEQATATVVPLFPDAWIDHDDLLLGEQMYDVELGDVPTDLLIDAKSHVDNLVREFTLAAAGAAAGQSATVPAHLADLIKTVTTRFAAARESIKRQAVGAASSAQPRTHLVLRLPVSAADAGADYLHALDEVDHYARAARLLTLATPPQHRAFRRWYVGSLVTQLRAVAAGEAPPGVASFEEFLLAEVGSVAAAQRLADRGARLQTVTAALARAVAPEDVAAVVVTEGVAALGASGGGLLMPLDDEHLGVPGVVGYSEAVVERLRAERPDAELPGAHTLRTGEAVWLESPAERDKRFPELAALEPTTVSLCAVPLVAGDTVVGALRFSFAEPRIFDLEERAFVAALAAQTALALERSNLIAIERAARERFAFLSRTTDLLGSSLEPDETSRHLMSVLVPQFAEWGAVYQPDPGTAKARPIVVAHRDAELDAFLNERFFTTAIDLHAAGGVVEALRTGRTIRYRRTPEEIRQRIGQSFDDPAYVARLAPTSSLAVAMRVGGEIMGVIGLVRTGAPEPFTDDDVELIEAVAARAAIALYNAQSFGRLREVAVTLQHSLLPQRLPEVRGVDIAWRYSPADVGVHVGGDWYDVIPVAPHRTALVIGDVMGRGLDAAAVMGQMRAAATALVATEIDPAAVLRGLDAVAGRLEQERLTTALVAVLDTAAMTLTVASAGHLPPLLVPPDGDPEYAEVEPGPPLGAGPGDYPQVVCELSAGTTVLLFTDGLVESRDRPVDDGLAMLLAVGARGAFGPERLCDEALAALAADVAHDDVAILAATVRADS
ncbi:MAG TPA: SpoIIE family protein phosphatase [Frankiaceae bacterium]|nr:SpoIIE family protein phosphatase [Frankiaceae bacterium]